MHEVEREKARGLPEGPGVYFMKGEGGAVLYVGKAASLRKRVASYFAGRLAHPRTRSLVQRIRRIAYLVTRSEIEALLLEANFIRDLKPPYNVELKDDKSYPMLKLTMGEEFPRLVITRNRSDRKAFYYGPYTDVKTLRQAVSYLKRIFPIRSCRTLPKTVCLEYHLKQCVGPCEFAGAREVHRRIVKELDLFLRGESREVMRELEARMRLMASRLEFEEASRLRDRLRALEDMLGQTRMLDLGSALEELRLHLGLAEIPHRIHGFDISNIQGRAAVGSRVSFLDGLAEKDQYRRFRVRTVAGIDDYAMIQEIVGRSLETHGGADPFPDLILIDGGLGHLNAARKVLAERHREKIPAISLAKEEEEIYRWNLSQPLRLPRRSRALRLLQQVRDEAHRFAVSYHKNLRAKAMVASRLDDIRGVGPAIKKRLMQRFGDVQAIQRASPGELAGVEGVSARLAETILEMLRTG
ncbi:MAG: excinuclease ABC subunit UvrC [Candidatus Omnitrophica bacterium]|nr:excinuclease ABC subunit UvrC [Candidatus Omnitrophota bacterium]